MNRTPPPESPNRGLRPIIGSNQYRRNRAMPPSRHILSFAEYAAIRHPTPYPVEAGRDGSRLLLLGLHHTTDPADPIFDHIDTAFSRLAPTFALHEGTPPAVEPEREIAIRRHGEAGLVRHLAARAGIDTASMDIPLADEASMLHRKIGQGNALVFLVVRQLASYNRKTLRMEFGAYFGEFFETIAPGLQLAAIDWPMIEAEHARLLGRPLVAGQVTGHETNPMLDDLPTQRIARWSNRRRDEHMLRLLLEALRRYQRVFATVGVTHAVMLEPALRAGA
jgi:hypothetical protein